MVKIDVLKRFFEFDIEFKKALFDLKPNPLYYGDPMKQVDSLYSKLFNYEKELCYILDKLNLKDYSKSVKQIFNRTKKELFTFTDNLDFFYKRCVAKMSPDLIDELNKNVFGYYVNCDPNSFLKRDDISLNEMLHILHKAIANDEQLLSQFDKTKVVSNKYDSISLIGKETPLASSVFDVLNLSKSIGETQIISLSNSHVICLIRDIGHALSIDIEVEDDKCNINYFMPKICNLDMVKRLPGINHISQDERYATGLFQVDMQSFPSSFLTFIANVPEDKHMDIDEHFTISDCLRKVSCDELIDFLSKNPAILKIKGVKDVLQEKIVESELPLSSITKMLESVLVLDKKDINKLTNNIEQNR